MLRLVGPQVECLFDLALPVEVPELPADLAVIDRLLEDPSVLAPVVAMWDARSRATLVREVGDSLQLRRFCRIALTERVPDESTIASSRAVWGRGRR